MDTRIYLVKDNDDVCCHCTCETAYITFPPQMGCPWCGCGWLFTCMSCRKAFTFARAVEVDETWNQLAVRDLRGAWRKPPEQKDVDGWIGAMKELLADVELGKQYVCLDGLFIPTDATGVSFRGWHSEHDLDFVPQVEALTDRSIVERLLANRDYWESRRVPTEDE
jgi:hypothetical protein